jgi:hypothetical protein
MPARKKPAARPAKTVKSTKPTLAKAAAAQERNKKAAVELVAPAVEPKLAPKAGKPPKLRRKPVRDSFTMPEADFALIATLKARALAGQREAKKSELLRAGLHALAALDRAALLQALAQLDPVKVGRPKNAR